MSNEIKKTLTYGTMATAVACGLLSIFVNSAKRKENSSILDLSRFSDYKRLLGRDINSITETTAVIFTDYQCFACAELHRKIKASTEQHKTNILIRNFPINSHKNAYIAAITAEIFRKEGKLEQIMDLLFDRSGNIDMNEIYTEAKKWGLDNRIFNKNNKSLAVKRVETDIKLGKDIGLLFTPTIILFEPGKKPKSIQSEELFS
jgi:protein-disulfide isomerase